MYDVNTDSKLEKVPPNKHSKEVLESTVKTFKASLSNYTNEFPQLRTPGMLSCRAISENFIVEASSEKIAYEVISQAEKLRVSLAKEWLGKELPSWKAPLAIAVLSGDNLLASGSTSYDTFENGDEVIFKNCIVEGSLDRIKDSSLPHELLHVTLATHFKKALPRWADEGASTYVESKIETQKYDEILIEHLAKGRCIPFATLFTLKQYPNDQMPLYSQGYSLTKYLVELGDKIQKDNGGNGLSGKQLLIKYLEKGMSNEDWVSATKEFYGFEKLGKLQTAWNKSVDDSIFNKSKPEEVTAKPANPVEVATKKNVRIILTPVESSELKFPPKSFK